MNRIHPNIRKEMKIMQSLFLGLKYDSWTESSGQIVVNVDVPKDLFDSKEYVLAESYMQERLMEDEETSDVLFLNNDEYINNPNIKI